MATTKHELSQDQDAGKPWIVSLPLSVQGEEAETACLCLVTLSHFCYSWVSFEENSAIIFKQLYVSLSLLLRETLIVSSVLDRAKHNHKGYPGVVPHDAENDRPPSCSR